MMSSLEATLTAEGNGVSPPPAPVPSSDPLASIHRVAAQLKLSRGATLFSEGEEAGFVYLIDEGVVRVSRSGESGQRQILAFRVPGDVFGFSDCGRYANSADAVTPTRVFRIPWSRLQTMMLQNPQLQYHLFEKMVRDFRQAQSRIVMLGQQNACQRLATFLLDLMELPGMFDEKNSLLRLPINRFDLADFLGTAPESAARAFAKLENRGLICRTTSRSIKIVDVRGLRQMRRAPRRETRVESLVAEGV